MRRAGRARTASRGAPASARSRPSIARRPPRRSGGSSRRTSRGSTSTPTAWRVRDASQRTRPSCTLRLVGDGRGVVFESVMVPATLEVARALVEATGYDGQLSLDLWLGGDGFTLLACRPGPSAGLFLLEAEEVASALFGALLASPRVAPAERSRSRATCSPTGEKRRATFPPLLECVGRLCRSSGARAAPVSRTPRTLARHVSDPSGSRDLAARPAKGHWSWHWQSSRTYVPPLRPAALQHSWHSSAVAAWMQAAAARSALHALEAVASQAHTRAAAESRSTEEVTVPHIIRVPELRAGGDGPAN